MIIIQNIEKTYGARKILDSVSYNMPEGGKIALVGNNGAGKTSLLNILCDFDKDFYGDVIKPKRLKLGFLPQIPNPNPRDSLVKEAMDGATQLQSVIREREELLKKLESDYSEEILDRYDFLERQYTELGGYRLEEDAKDILQGLGFKEEQFEAPIDTFSGGWRMRVEFAKMLLNNPNFLILDEPTNHLDLPSIEWFEKYLQKFQGTILFVSHDKELLNRLPTHILHLRSGKLTGYKGNFDHFLDEFTMKQSQNTDVAKNLGKRFEHIEKFVERFRYKPSKARQVQSRLKMLAKMKTLEDSLEFESLEDSMSLKLSNPKPSAKLVVKFDKLRIGYDKALLKPLNFSIERGQKVAILGLNGLGKSTTLKTILGKIKPIDGEYNWGQKAEIGYFAQEHLEGLNENANMLENVRESESSLKEVEIRSLLGALGLKGDDVLKKLNVLSGGEKNRVALACILAKKPNILLLDEPTNHLDLSASENLAEALLEFTGTVIFVSHNRAFIDAVATHRIYLEEGKLPRLEDLYRD